MPRDNRGGEPRGEGADRAQSGAAFVGASLVGAALVLAMVFGPTPALALTSGSGAVPLTAIGVPYVQSFDSLTNTPNATTSNVLPSGWFIDESGTSARNDEEARALLAAFNFPFRQ